MYPLLLYKAYQNHTYAQYILLTRSHTVYLKLNEVDYNYSVSQYVNGYQSHQFQLIIDDLQYQKMHQLSLILNDQISGGEFPHSPPFIRIVWIVIML